MWESNMCIDKATLAELELVQNKLEPAEVQARDRSPSPIPGIQRALFQAGVIINPGKPERKRSNKRSLEEELKRNSDNKENRLKDDYKRGGNVCRGSNSVFRFPSLSIPSISVQANYEEDEVFCTSATPSCPSPSSSRILLTPSTANTPLLSIPSSATSLNTPLLSIPSSPALERGLCCSTPNRLRLEAEGVRAGSVVLGRGAYGTVVLGRWRGCKVAIKVMEAESGGTSARRRNSLESELRARNLDHENIIRVHQVHAVEQSHAVIIMEYVGSRNLHSLLVERKEKSLGRSWLLGAAAQVSNALQHCHQRKVVHLDVKPSNILVTSGGVCKLGDFGCSVGLASNGKGPAGELTGTPGYQAPELLKGEVPSRACDVYSLGILLWQLDSRSVPYAGQHPQVVMFQVVSMLARPTPPPSCTAAVGMPAFTSIYSTCWAAAPCERPNIDKVAKSVATLRCGTPTPRLKGLR